MMYSCYLKELYNIYKQIYCKTFKDNNYIKIIRKEIEQKDGTTVLDPHYLLFLKSNRIILADKKYILRTIFK